MLALKESLMTILRDRTSSINQFREAAGQLAHILAYESTHFVGSHAYTVTTPLSVNTTGAKLHEHIVLIPILRSGLALLPAFVKCYPSARVGFIGLKRDEKTAIAHLYYKNMPLVQPQDKIIVLDPMIATGGSGVDALEIVTQLGIEQEHIAFIGVLGCNQGIANIKNKFPRITLSVVSCDHELNAARYIVPGLGDFGDRYFGTE